MRKILKPKVISTNLSNPGTPFRKKNLLQRVETIFDFLEQQQDIVYSAYFEEIGLDSTSVKAWIDIIQFIQTKPHLIIEKAGRYMTIKLGDISTPSGGTD